MSHVPTVLKSDRSVFDKMFPVDDNAVHNEVKHNLWNKISADTVCIQVCFCMLVISFYFVNCVIISCKLSFSSHFTRI